MSQLVKIWKILVIHLYKFQYKIVLTLKYNGEKPLKMIEARYRPEVKWCQHHGHLHVPYCFFWDPPYELGGWPKQPPGAPTGRFLSEFFRDNLNSSWRDLFLDIDCCWNTYDACTKHGYIVHRLLLNLKWFDKKRISTIFLYMNPSTYNK